MNVAFQMDDPAGFNLASDSTVCLLKEAAKRGHALYYYHPSTLTRNAQGKILALLYPFYYQATDGSEWYRLGEAQWKTLEQMNIVWVRQDPPYDMNYLSTTYLLDRLPPHVRVFNAPSALRNAPEKLSPLQFPEWLPPTLVTQNFEQVEAFFTTHGAVVLKPLYSYGGRGVVLVEQAEKLQAAFADIMASQPNVPLVVQTFIPEVRTRELRVLLVDGEVAGAFARIPQGDDIRSNLRLGGRAEAVTLTPREQAVCAALKDWLKSKRLLFVGLDLIGGYLNEINTTSPTGLKTYEDLTGVNVAAKIWDAIEA